MAKRDWRADYRDLESMTEDELLVAVAALPVEIREKLAAGPLDRRFGCAVCEAFGRAYYMNVVPDLDDPMWLAFAYHEVPKKDMKTANQQWYGPLANETYTRCIATYRAAGWMGEASEPNA